MAKCGKIPHSCHGILWLHELTRRALVNALAGVGEVMLTQSLHFLASVDDGDALAGACHQPSVQVVALGVGGGAGREFYAGNVHDDAFDFVECEAAAVV